MNKKIYYRKAKGGGLNIKQLVFFGVVITLSKNDCRSNGDVKGWNLKLQKRNTTNL